MGLRFQLLGRGLQIATVIAGLALILMMVHIATDVVAKYVFGIPMPGTITVVSNYYMVLVAFLPLAFTERNNGHISVEVLTTHFPGRAQRILNVLGMILSAGIFAALAWRGWYEAGEARSVGTFEIEQNVKLLTWPARYLLPLGCGLITLVLLAKIWIALRRDGGQNLDEPFF